MCIRDSSYTVDAVLRAFQTRTWVYCTETQIPSEAILKPSTPHFRRTLDRLGGLSPAADMALAYAVADWWDQGLDHTADGWSKAGVQVR